MPQWLPIPVVLSERVPSAHTTHAHGVHNPVLALSHRQCIGHSALQKPQAALVPSCSVHQDSRQAVADLLDMTRSSSNNKSRFFPC